MGIFILTKDGIDPARAETALNRAGFATAWRWQEAGTRLLLFRKLGGEGGRVALDGDDFTAVVGNRMAGDLGVWAAVERRQGLLAIRTDALGACKVYRNARGTVFSNSFVALCELGLAGGLDAHGCYDYVWNGTVHGTGTFFSGIRTLPIRPLPAAEPLPCASLDEAAEACVERLRRLFRRYPGNIRSALSGGFDSRLLLALLLDAGISPRLFVYGRAGDVDVKVAKAICAGEGLALEHIDKQAAPPPSPDRFAAELEADLYAFDGWKNAGLFDDGSDRRDRLARSQGQVLLNGSVGECFRNFYYLRDGRFSVRDLVGVFHSMYDPAACTEAFDPEAYEERLAADLAAAVGVDPQAHHPRSVVEMCYPLGRGRFWTARDAAINQRFGTALFPFLEPSVFQGTWDIPLRFKHFGRLEARMIALLSPGLAAYGSAYGFAFDRPPPPAYRLKMTLTHWKPVWLRRRSYRLQHRVPEARPAVLQPRTLDAVLRPGFPATGALFKPAKVHGLDAFNRLCTVEYLAQRYL